MHRLLICLHTCYNVPKRFHKRFHLFLLASDQPKNDKPSVYEATSINFSWNHVFIYEGIPKNLILCRSIYVLSLILECSNKKSPYYPVSVQNNIQTLQPLPHSSFLFEYVCLFYSHFIFHQPPGLIRCWNWNWDHSELELCWLSEAGRQLSQWQLPCSTNCNLI